MQKKPKILFIVSGLGIGGVQKQTVEIANAMVKRNFEAVFLNLAIRNDENFLKDISPEIPVVTSRYFSKLSKCWIFSSFISSIYAIYETLKIVQQQGTDIVYARHWAAKFPAAATGLILGMKNKIVLAETSVSEHEIRRKKRSALSKKLIFIARKLTYKIAGTVVTNSTGLAEKTKNYFGIERIHVIKNGIRPETLVEKARETVNHPFLEENIPVGVSVGRLDPQKDFSSLIEAVAIVNLKTQFRLIIVGGGWLESTLKEKAEELNISENVSIIGFSPNPHKYTLRCSMFICSSLYEGLSSSLLEAAALGIPMVSTNHPFGANEIIENGKSGLLVPVRDPEAMAEAILKLLKNTTLAKEMGTASKEKTQSFHIDKMLLEYEKLFKEVVNL